MDAREPRKPQAGSAREVLLAFLRLGVTSFGGPVAHIGYLRSEFVLRRQWLSERAYADLVALCQFLPGPASSQTGGFFARFAISGEATITAEPPLHGLTIS